MSEKEATCPAPELVAFAVDATFDNTVSAKATDSTKHASRQKRTATWKNRKDISKNDEYSTGNGDGVFS
eukprot:CAMPEP_0169107992 /NCGR_PEP_ID=MMETSP1015-20121227/25187_1 /TAXON_ID=342587 /ORGANISM="Karlodinium micrum, Strain CCMP2283" /LENGTH=68 /DNA_ID=CAMNT_0009169579 /DNA_START=725 /DNA_END=927 /DNA_ORIENTATION=+